MPLPRPTIRIDLPRLRDNVARIRRLCAVPILAVVKANAYGLGANPIARAIEPLVDGFCVFTLDEAVAADLRAITTKPTYALGPPDPASPADYLAHRVHPAVSNPASATALKPARPILSIDTGMQRFACPPEQIDAALQAGDIREAFTHATRLEHVQKLQSLCAGRSLRLHAAASALLEEPAARLDAVRPGLALYIGAVEVSAPLAEARDSRGPAGYTGFTAPRHGVILLGYSHGLRPGPCIVNGVRRRILEVGMQSAFVELGPQDRPADPVTLLGQGLTEHQLAADWKSTPHEVLLRLAQIGEKTYIH